MLPTPRATPSARLPVDGSRRVVVVAGASSGIGRATAHACAERGDAVVLVSRSGAALDAVAAECRDRGGDALVLPADVRDEAGMRAVADRAMERYGRVDAWVHSAAVMAYGTVEDVPGEVFDAVVTTNLLGLANAARVVLPLFRAQRGGTLVVVGSLLDKTVAPVMGAYVTSKWGVRGLTRVLRIETRDAPGVHVCSVAPAGVDTPIYSQAANYSGRLGQPPPPVDSPEKVARAVLRVLDAPRRQVVVGPTSRVVSLGFTLLPAVYDALVGPLVQRAALSRRPVPPTPGNVHEARPAGEEVHGGWRRRQVRALTVAGAALTGASAAAAGGFRLRRSRRPTSR